MTPDDLRRLADHIERIEKNRDHGIPFTDGAAVPPTQQPATPAPLRQWVLCETVCNACEQRCWSSSEQGAYMGPRQCPRCMRMSLVGVHREYETLTFPIGSRHQVTVKLPKHECNHATHALRSMAQFAAELRTRGEL